MSERITAKAASRRLPGLLDRVRDDRETFVIVHRGEEAGQLVPLPRTRPTTMKDLFELLGTLEPPDPNFADDLEKIQASQPMAREFPWPS